MFVCHLWPKRHFLHIQIKILWQLILIYMFYLRILGAGPSTFFFMMKFCFEKLFSVSSNRPSSAQIKRLSFSIRLSLQCYHIIIRFCHHSMILEDFQILSLMTKYITPQKNGLISNSPICNYTFKPLSQKNLDVILCSSYTSPKCVSF